MQNLFESALSISLPWFISEINFSTEEKRLDIYIDFESGSRFPIDDSKTVYPVYDTEEKMWRHLNFFEHECYLHCRVPRVKTDKGYRRISPPWAGKTNGFTLLFEALLLQLCTHMPVATAARMTSVNDKKLWRMLEKYVDETRSKEDFSLTTAIGVDETSRAKGHQYITLFVDLDQRRTLFITDGKDSSTVESFVADFENHKGEIKSIRDISCDMSPAFIKGVRKNLPDAAITFDKFHIIKIINESVDTVRKREVGTNPILKHSKYALLKSPTNRSAKQHKKLQVLSKQKHNLDTYRAVELRDAFMDIYRIEDENMFEQRLREWHSWARRSRIPEMKQVAKTIMNHWDGVLKWRTSGLSNGILEGLNSLIQAAKSKARGYRTSKCFKIIAYLVTAKLDFGNVNPHFHR